MKVLGSRIKISLKESIDNIKNFEGILRKNEVVEMVMFWKQDMPLNCQSTKHNFTLSFSIRELSSARLVGETFSKGRKHE